MYILKITVVGLLILKGSNLKKNSAPQIASLPLGSLSFGKAGEIGVCGIGCEYLIKCIVEVSMFISKLLPESKFESLKSQSFESIPISFFLNLLRMT